MSKKHSSDLMVKFTAMVKKVACSAKIGEDGPIVTTALGFLTSALDSERIGILNELQHADQGVEVTIVPVQRPLAFGEKAP